MDVDAETKRRLSLHYVSKLADASRRADCSVIKDLLKLHCDPNAALEDGHRGLHVAVQSGSAEAVSTLLDARADPNLPEVMGTLPLEIAAWQGQVQIAKLLLLRGADPNATGFNGWTSLFLAAKQGHTDVVLMLLAHGAKPGRRALVASRAEPVTPISLAMEARHTEVVTVLNKALQESDGWRFKNCCSSSEGSGQKRKRKAVKRMLKQAFGLRATPGRSSEDQRQTTMQARSSPTLRPIRTVSIVDSQPASDSNLGSSANEANVSSDLPITSDVGSTKESNENKDTVTQHVATPFGSFALPTQDFDA